VKGRLDLAITDLGPTALKNITEPLRVYALWVGESAKAKPSTPQTPAIQIKPTSRALLGIAALLIGIAAGASYWLFADRPAAVAIGRPRSSLRRRKPRSGASRSSFCRSPISQTTPARTISPMESPRV